MPPSFPFADSPEFLRLIRREDEPDLTRLCFEIARDAYPGLDPRPYLARIDAFADRVRDRCPQGAKARHILGQINWVLFVEEGFRGNVEDYGDPRNSYLNLVIDRKLGIPISLSALYLAVADRLGLAMSGVNFPGHFMIRAGRGPSAIFVDPFHEGALLDTKGCEAVVSRSLDRPVTLSHAAFGPCSTRKIVLRMLRNLKASYLRDNDHASALPALRRIVALTGGNLFDRRDLGIACVHAGMAGEALSHLTAYLEAGPDEADAEDVAALVRVASRELAGRN